MKKIFSVLCLFLLFTCVSCDLFDSLVYPDTVTLEVNADSDDTVIFCAVSTESSDVSASYTPSVNTSYRSLNNTSDDENLLYTVEEALGKVQPEAINAKNEAIAQNLISSGLARGSETAFTPEDKLFNPEDIDTGEKTTIYIINASSTGFEKTFATKMYESDYCNVFYVANTDKVSLSQLENHEFNDKTTGSVFEALGKIYDEKIYTTIFDIFGDITISTQYKDVISTPEKLNIVVADLGWDYEVTEKNGGGVAGYYYAGDLLTDKGYYNQDAIIWLDTYFVNKEVESTYTTIAHEFNHMLNFINKTLNNGLQYSTWYTEMLSGLADGIYESYLCPDISAEKSIYYDRLIFFNEFSNLGFGNWRESSKYYIPYEGADVLINYGNVFAFGNFILRNFGGFSTIKAIATNKYIDEESIIKAVKANNSSVNTMTKLLKKFTEIYISMDTGITDNLCNLNKSVSFMRGGTEVFKIDGYSGAPEFSDEYKRFINNTKNDYGQRYMGQYGINVYGYIENNYGISSIDVNVFTAYEITPFVFVISD